MVSRMLAFDTSADVTAVAVLEADEVIVEDSAATAERHAETLLPRIAECLERARLELSEIDVFAVGVGPGSFTGVRVGVATAKGLAFATGKPLRGVVSLAALAASVLECDPGPALLVAPILDAYKGEVFAALYSVTEQQTALLVEPFHAAPEIAAAQLTRVAEGRALEIGLEAQGSRLQVRDHASLKSKFSGGSPERAAPLCIHVLGSGYRRYAERIAPQWDARAIVVLDPRWDAPHARHIAREARRLLRTEGASDVARLAPLYVRDSDAQLPKAPLRL